MNLLWISNYHFPDVCEKLNIAKPVVGGWMYAGAKNLIFQNQSIKLSVASHYDGDELLSFISNEITYYLIPERLSDNYNKSFEKHWEKIYEAINPDIVHIHGSEYPNGLAFVRACGKKGVVVSIQGMVSVYERYYFGSISQFKMIINTTLRDLLRWDNIFQNQRKMKKRGMYEVELLKKIDNVIGRTYWDRSHAWSINSNASYYLCNETLRSVFYNKKWDIEKCERYSIFLSQAFYPIKGLHMVLQAIPLILKLFPKTKIYVSGDSFGLEKKFTKNGYGNYLSKLIKQNNLRDRINYLGKLNEEEMCERFLKSHVFICPSSIENSANSIGESQLLGVPCIASFVGGSSDLIEHGKTGFLYRFEEYEMLANLVCGVFSNDELAKNVSQNSRKKSSIRHDPVSNAKQLDLIYKNIKNEV